MRLTKRVIDSMAYRASDGRRQVAWDDELPGFGVRVYPNGKKSFVLSYRLAGRKRLMTLGAYGVKTVDEARKQARKHLVTVDSGIDPLETRKRDAHGESFKELSDTYIEQYAKLHKHTWREDQRRINKYILPAWGNRKVQSITREDVRKLHSKVGATRRYEANRILVLIGRMYALAASQWGLVPEHHPNPARGIKRYAEEKRDRWITPQELPKLAQAIDAEPNVYVRNAFWLYLLTGVRKRELLTARWSDIDWERQELRLGKTKAGRIHYVPLSAAAVAILRSLPRIENNPYILPGLIEGHHLVNIDKPWTRIRKAAGVEDVHIHDLRRTLGSWLAQSGNSLHLIGRVLNHSTQSTTAIYARFGQDNVRQALEEHAAKLLGVAGKRPAAEVVEIRQGKQEATTNRQA